MLQLTAVIREGKGLTYHFFDSPKTRKDNVCCYNKTPVFKKLKNFKGNFGQPTNKQTKKRFRSVNFISLKPIMEEIQSEGNEKKDK